MTDHGSSPDIDTPRRKERISMAREICLHRGENPNSVDRGGNEGWEKYEPLAGACIREAERLIALRSHAVAATSTQYGAEFDRVALDIVHQIEIIPNDWHPTRRTAHAQCLIIEALRGVAQCEREPSQLVEVCIKRMATLADSALDGRPWEKESQTQMRLAINLLREAYSLPSTNRVGLLDPGIDGPYNEPCEHKSVHDGPRVEMRWGTAPTQVCDCGMWRINLHVPGVWRAPPITRPQGNTP